MPEDKTSYEDRLGRVIAYLFDHLDEELDLNRLAEIAYMSPFHFHRIYQAIQGESAVATVKRLRLQRAAALLGRTTLPVAEIAKRPGYANLQSFTRIFRSVYGRPPAEYRREGGPPEIRRAVREGCKVKFPVEIKRLEPVQLAVLDHSGPYITIGKAFETLGGFLGMRGLLGPQSRMIGFYYDDPGSVPEDQLRSAAGFSLTDFSQIQPPYRKAEIPGGDHAILRFQGPYSDLHVPWRWIYSEWLVKSGREVAEEPPFEEYLNSPRDTSPERLLTNICIPLK
jgi:AraC family transcriptional regulator